MNVEIVKGGAVGVGRKWGGVWGKSEEGVWCWWWRSSNHDDDVGIDVGVTDSGGMLLVMMVVK